MNILEDSLGLKDKLKLEKLNNIISYNESNEQLLFLLSTDTQNLNQLFETYFLNSLDNCIKIEDIKDGLFKSILSQLDKYKNKYILINLFDIDDYINIMEEFQFKRDYIPQERLKFVFLFNQKQYESFKTKAYDFFSFNNFFHHFIDNTYTFVNDFDLSELENMIKEYEKIKNTNISKESRMKYLYDIGIQSSEFSQSIIALQYYDEAIKIAKKLKDGYMIAIINYCKSNVYNNLGNLNNGLIYAKESLRIFKKLKYKRGIVGSNIQMGVSYKYSGDFDLSLKNYENSLKISIKENYKELHADSLIGIGLIYREMNNFNLALKYENEALSLYSSLNNNIGIGVCKGNIGLIYQDKKNFDLALKYQQEALSIDKDNKQIRNVGITLGNIGNIYKDKNDLQLGLRYQNEALEILKDIGYIQGVSETLNDIANTYVKLKNYNEAEKYREEAMSIAKSLGFHAIIAKIEKDKINNKKES